MYLSQITFGADNNKPKQRNELQDAAESYLASLLKNGQLYDKYLFSWSNKTLIAYVYLPRPNALEKQYHSTWSRSYLNSVIELFGTTPKVEILDDDIPKRFSAWKKCSSFYLFTHAFDITSPLCCGTTGAPIPLYLLPLSQEDREALYSWARAYYHYDNIWLASTALEIPSYKEIADPRSTLSIRGRDICSKIEQITKIPTFYYLQRYWGRNENETKRPCPSCGKKWHISKPSGDSRPFYDFHFRCKPCKLVSHCATSYDDERHARIGEFKK